MSMKVKFILTYVAGIVTGIVLIFAVGLFMAKSCHKECQPQLYHPLHQDTRPG